MKLYLGVLPTELKKGDYEFDKILISYFDFKTQYAVLKEKINSYNDVFVDSGAFGAFGRKITLNVNDYIEFIKANDIKTYAALDVIYNPDATRKNFEIMQEAGLNPIPTFHFGTNIKELKNYMQYPYIALGGLVPHAAEPAVLTHWLDYCFKYLVRDIHDKGLKVHGFGVTNFDILERYPFYSVDSTSWKIGLKFGGMYKKQAAHKKPVRESSDYAEFLRITKDNKELSQRNINAYIESEKFLTRLWAERGFTFKD